RIGMQIVNTTAHLEQIKRVIGKLLCGDARRERAEVLRVALHAADARGDGRARIRIVEDELDQRREAQSQAFVVSLRELLPQSLVKQERRLEIRARRGPLSPAHAIAQIQLASLALRSSQQPLQATAQVRGLADVRLAAFVRSPKHEHSRPRRHCGEQLGVAVRDTLDALRWHEKILLHYGDTEAQRSESQRQTLICADFADESRV